MTTSQFEVRKHSKYIAPVSMIILIAVGFRSSSFFHTMKK
jgi:hypothetical protein